MDKLFVLNPAVDILGLKDAISERVKKARAILTSLMFGVLHHSDDIEINAETVYHAMWAADDCLDELDTLYERLDTLTRSECILRK